jgi:hypothetical protein
MEAGNTARLKDWLLTGPGGGVSRMTCAPEGAIRIKMMFRVVFWDILPCKMIVD